jgi:signal peptidase I
MASAVFALLCVGLLLVGILLRALLLRLGLAWAKSRKATVVRIVLATILVVALEFGLNVTAGVGASLLPVVSLPLAAVAFVAGVMISCAFFTTIFEISFVRSLQAWLPTLLAPVVMVALLLLVVRPFVFEAFTGPTNAMAPTLLGNHWIGTCTTCGSPSYCTPVPEYRLAVDPQNRICDQFHVTQPKPIDDEVHSADRFLVAKFVRPQRWDIIVFRYPEQPSVLYVMRLVGLPGEEITIRDGQVCAGGQVLTPPDDIRGIEYLSELDRGFQEAWGSPNRPAKLADDEYFVLGDFSAQSMDSRFWEQGASGHAPYAVPESHLYGVVTHIYWPPSRWRAFR